MADENPLTEKFLETGKTQIVNVPMPSKEQGQRSINLTDLFITRWTPPWSRPPSLPAYTWRAWVLNQPIAIAAREVLLSMILGLEWIITSRDSNQKDDLEATRKYYTKLLQNGGYYLGTDWSSLIEWIVGDLLDIPFGGGVEIGRKGDDPKGRVVWLRPLDGGTLYPTLNASFPVVQYYQGYTAVAFPDYAIARIFMTPRPEIFREGWGIAPPEKIYFALDLLNRGDKYYANLLLDVPPAGILDLGDMERSSAQDWVDQYRTFIAGTTDAWRVPVLYEHNNKVEFIPFGKNPNDIMYDHIMLKYAALVCSAYGISLNDIGLQTTSRSGETLAGSIRSSAQTRHTGVARLKQKVKAFIEHILPSSLQFDWIDYDDEHNVAMGRARLATATALNLAVQAGAISPEEFRAQMLQDGLLMRTIPDKPPSDAKPQVQNTAPKNPGALGHGVPPSMGGEGEIKSFVVRSKRSDNGIDSVIKSLSEIIIPLAIARLNEIPDDELFLVRSLFTDELVEDSAVQEVMKVMMAAHKKPILSLNNKLVTTEPAFEAVNQYTDDKKKDMVNRLKEGINGLLATSVAKSIGETLYEIQLENLSKFNPQEPVADSGEVDYNYLMGEIKDRVMNTLDATIENYIRQTISEMEK